MSDESNALHALKNAWTGAVNASERVRELSTTVAGLPDTTPLAQIDLETYHNAALAQALAVQALRGLIEELRKKTAKG